MLFHVSEETSLELFEPRPDPSGRLGDVVWAIDEEHLPNYLLPRDCPRVTFAASPQTSAADRERFMGGVPASRVVAIETAWYEQAVRQRLYVYHMPEEEFELVDGCAGYYVARHAVLPTGCDLYPSALDELLRRDVELRFVRTLWPLRDAVVQSTLAFSIIRMRNAQSRSEQE